MKRFLIILISAIIVIGGVVLLKKDGTQAPGTPTNHTLGKGTSGVKLVQYGDFQCPGCGAFYPIVKQVMDHYKDEITFQFVNFPLTQIHLNALSSSRAAEAASKQGKFWEMHDLLYMQQQSWSQSTNATTTFNAYATQLGLNTDQFKKDYASSETNAVINADVATGQKLKITGTPTFFLDGKRLEDNNAVATVQKFIALIDAEILAKTGKPSISTTPIAEPTAPNGTPAPSSDPDKNSSN